MNGNRQLVAAVLCRLFGHRWSARQTTNRSCVLRECTRRDCNTTSIRWAAS